jgi:hypothetical protein
MLHQESIHPGQQAGPPARFAVLFEGGKAGDIRRLCSAPDGDGATLAFYDEWARLTAEQATGSLLLVCQDAEPRTLLRLPVG